jgi:hypothetical protein
MQPAEGRHLFRESDKVTDGASNKATKSDCDEVTDKAGAVRHHLLRESDKSAASLRRIRQTDRRSGFFSLMKQSGVTS